MIDLLSSPEVWARTLQAATSILWVVVGGYIAKRSGVLNIALEGSLLVGAFAGAATTALTANSGLGAVAAIVAGGAMGLLLALFVVLLSADALLTGLAFNLAALGGTAILLQALFGVRGTLQTPSLMPLPRVQIPGLEHVPWLGQVLSGHTTLTYAAWFSVPLLAWWLRRTPGGLNLRVTGERPEIAAGAGHSPTRVRVGALVIGGLLIGAGGAQLALGDVALFQENMTAGRGFIALALIFMIGNRTMLLLPLALLFASADALGVSMQAVGFPSELTLAVPYVVVVIVMFHQAGRAARRAHAPHLPLKPPAPTWPESGATDQRPARLKRTD